MIYSWNFQLIQAFHRFIIVQKYIVPPPYSNCDICASTVISVLIISDSLLSRKLDVSLTFWSKMQYIWTSLFSKKTNVWSILYYGFLIYWWEFLGSTQFLILALNSWDEWLDVNSLLKCTEENVRKQKELKEKHSVEKNTKPGRLSQDKTKNSIG